MTPNETDPNTTGHKRSRQRFLADFSHLLKQSLAFSLGCAPSGRVHTKEMAKPVGRKDKKKGNISALR